MLLNILKNSVTSRTKFSTLTLLIGLSSALGGCSVVMSPDNETLVGAVADYTPFEMDDDNSIFGNKRPKKLAHMRASNPLRAEASFTPQDPVDSQNLQVSAPANIPLQASEPSPENQAVVTTTAAMIAQHVPAIPTTTATVTATNTTVQPTKDLQNSKKSEVQSAGTLTKQDKIATIYPVLKAAVSQK